VALQSLLIENFRNIRALDWRLAPGLNILEGENAQGKTNLLEALYVLANGRSFRTSEATSLIQFGCESARLRGHWLKEELDTRIDLQIFPDEKRLSAQGKILKSYAKIHEYFRALIFTPDSSSLFRATPGLRRRYFDVAIGVHRPEYGATLARYQSVLRQRNRALELGVDEPTLESFDEQWADLAEPIWQIREAYLGELKPFWERRFAELSGMPIVLAPNWQRDAVGAESIASRELMARLAGQRGAERRRCRTLWGPHRDDLRVDFSGHAVKEVGSQGQQRLLVIALKLAEADLFRKQWRRSPVFLFDDLGSELDQERQQRLIANLREMEAQTVLSTTDATAYRGLESRQWRVKNGELF